LGGKSCIQDLCHPIAAKGMFMAEAVVKLRLNQQQLELMDRTIAQGIAPDRVSLVRLALREYAAARRAESKAEPAQ
jgi:Arc/MetJ-type ribon-helix-helix transcriptional regulator